MKQLVASRTEALPAEANASSTNCAWDPGTFTDDDLVQQFRKPAVAAAKKRFEQGVLVELTRGEKPTARFLDDPCTIRFLVKGDLRYVTVDCAEPLLATFIPMAVWAFRQLAADQTAGLVAFQLTDLPVPLAVLNELEELLCELCQEGLSNVGSSWPARCTRLEATLVIQPVCVVFDDGKTRMGVQPWVDHSSQLIQAGIKQISDDSEKSLLQIYLKEFEQELAELVLTGTSRCTPSVSKRWHELALHGQQLGLVRFVKPLEELAQMLEQKSMNPEWRPVSSASMLLEVLLRYRVSLDAVS